MDIKQFVENCRVERCLFIEENIVLKYSTQVQYECVESCTC